MRVTKELNLDVLRSFDVALENESFVAKVAKRFRRGAFEFTGQTEDESVS